MTVTWYPRRNTVELAQSGWANLGLRPFASMDSNGSVFVLPPYTNCTAYVGASGPDFTDGDGRLHVYDRTDSALYLSSPMHAEGISFQSFTAEQTASDDYPSFRCDRSAIVCVSMGLYGQYENGDAISWDAFNYSGFFFPQFEGNDYNGFSIGLDSVAVGGSPSWARLNLCRIDEPFACFANIQSNRADEPSDIVGHDMAMNLNCWVQATFCETTP